MKRIIRESVRDPNLFLRPLNINILYKTAEIIESDNPDKMLDIGSGICLLLSIVDLPAGALSVGVDVRMDNLLEGKTVLHHHNREEVKLVRSWGQVLPFKNESFNVVSIITTILNIDNMEVILNILKEMRRVLQLGGLGVFEFRNKLNFVLGFKHSINRLKEKNLPLKRFTRREFRKLLLQTGWIPERYVPIWPGTMMFTPCYIYTARRS